MEETSKTVPDELLRILMRPGVLLVHGPEGAGKSTLIMYLIYKTISPREKVLLLDSSNSIEVFRRLSSKIGEEFVRRVYRVPIRSWEDQSKWVLRMGSLRGFRKVVFDEFTLPYIAKIQEVKNDVRACIRLHRELIFQVAYLRYISTSLNSVFFLVSCERSTRDPFGGPPMKKIASRSIRVLKGPSNTYELEVESDERVSKIILGLDP